MLSRHTTELPSQPLCYDCFLHFGTGSHKLVLEPTCGPGKPLTLDPAASVSTQLGWWAYATRPSLALIFWKCLCLYSVSACYWFQRERASSFLFLQSWGRPLNVCLCSLAWPSFLVWETLTFHLALTLIPDLFICFFEGHLGRWHQLESACVILATWMCAQLSLSSFCDLCPVLPSHISQVHGELFLLVAFAWEFPLLSSTQPNPCLQPAVSCQLSCSPVLVLLWDHCDCDIFDVTSSLCLEPSVSSWCLSLVSPNLRVSSLLSQELLHIVVS